MGNLQLPQKLFKLNLVSIQLLEPIKQIEV